MKSAILAIRIIGDATSAVAAMDKAQRASMSFKDKVGKASVAVETVFGDSSKQMLAWSKNAAKSVGLSQNEYNEFATLVGSQLQNFGMSAEQSASKTNELIGLGADLSSMFGGTTADAVDALSSALKGEMDPIEKYGISLNDATLQAQAASMGLGDLYKSGDRNAKMQATLAAITAQSGKAVGNFAREADTAQGQQQRMNAAFENAKATLGEALLPFLTQMAEKLAGVATWIQANTSWLGPLVGVIAAVAAAACLGLVVYTSLIAWLGTVAVAAHSIAITAEQAFYIPGYGMQMAAATLCGFSAGEKDEKKLTQYALAICVIAVLLMGLMSTLLFFAPGMILSIFTRDAAVIALGIRLLRIVAFSEPFFAAAIIMEGVFNGVGDVKVPFAISLATMWGVRIVCTFVVVQFLHLGLPQVWLCMVADNVTRCILLLVRYFGGWWKKPLGLGKWAQTQNTAKQ